MDLDVSDVEELFEMLDAGGDGRLSAEELVVGVGKLRGASRAMDLRPSARLSLIPYVFQWLFMLFQWCWACRQPFSRASRILFERKSL